MRFATRLLLATTALAVVAASAQAQTTELVIGNLLELTGPLSVFGPPMEKAASLAVAEANRAAEAAGLDFSVSAVSEDTQGDAQAALSAARNLLNQGATCLIGPATTPEAVAIGSGLTIQRQVVLFPQASSSRLRETEDEDTIFRTVPPDNLQALALSSAAESFLGSADGKTVSLAYLNVPYGEGLANSFTESWQAKGGQIAGPVVFDPSLPSFDAEAGSIVSGNPDAYIIIDYPDTFARLGAALLRTGQFDPGKLFVPDTISFTEIPENVPPEVLEGAMGVRAGTPESTEAYQAFDRLWQEAGGVEHYSLDANTFDAALVCFLAAVAGGSAESAAIQQNVRAVTSPPGEKYNFTQLAEAVQALQAGEDIDFEGVSGPLDLGPEGDPTTSLYDVFQYQDGRLAVQRQIDVQR